MTPRREGTRSTGKPPKGTGRQGTPRKPIPYAPPEDPVYLAVGVRLRRAEAVALADRASREAKTLDVLVSEILAATVSPPPDGRPANERTGDPNG